MNLLHLDSSILGNNSVSRQLSAAVVERLKAAHPDTKVAYRDLAESPVPHLNGAYLAGQSGVAVADSSAQADLELGNALLAEFLSADVVVIGVGFYNFTIPSQLKAWIDRIVAAGKTFTYGENGPVGLAGNKRLILTIASGAVYGDGTPWAVFEHAESYLRAIFGFLGITQPEVIRADGMKMTALREQSIETALKAIANLAA